MNGANSHTTATYLAISFDGPSERLFALSSSVMEWGDGTWVVDLGPCLSYWAEIASRKKVGILSVIREEVCKVLGINARQSAGTPSLKPGFTAALGNNAIQSVLLLHHLIDRNLQGLVSIRSEAGRALFSGLSWDTFWKVLGELSTLSYDSEVCGFSKPLKFRKNILLLRRSVARLGLNSPYEISRMGASAIARRFGADIGEVFNHLESNSVQTGLFRTSIWKSFVIKNPPSIHEPLDYAVREWKAMEEPLKDSMTRLSKVFPEYLTIQKLRWTLTKDDMSVDELEVSFRAPYRLKADMQQGFKAILTQFELSFDGFTRSSSKEQCGDIEVVGIESRSIVSWKITVVESSYEAPVERDLFQTGCDVKDSKISELQNIIGSELTRHTPSSTWLPEVSFQHLDFNGNSTCESLNYKSQLASARCRPAYLISPKKIAAKEVPAKLEFLEEVSGVWWKNRDDLVRHYYKARFANGSVKWVFKNSAGDWFEHGTFS